jgi:hypothetical protein
VNPAVAVDPIKRKFPAWNQTPVFRPVNKHVTEEEDYTV